MKETKDRKIQEIMKLDGVRVLGGVQVLFNSNEQFEYMKLILSKYDNLKQIKEIQLRDIGELKTKHRKLLNDLDAVITQLKAGAEKEYILQRLEAAIQSSKLG